MLTLDIIISNNEDNLKLIIWRASGHSIFCLSENSETYVAYKCHLVLQIDVLINEKELFSLIHISAIVTGVDQVRLNDDSLVIPVMCMDFACFGELRNIIMGRSKKSYPGGFPAGVGAERAVPRVFQLRYEQE